MIQHMLNKRSIPLPSPSRSRGPKPTRMDPDQLLDAAQAVFAEEGLRAATLRAIARKAGCDPALIYYHFQDKEAMFEALLDRTIGPVVKELAALGDPQDPRTVAEFFWKVISIYHAHLGGNAGLRGLVRGEIVRGGEGIRENIAKRVLPVLEAIGRITHLGIKRGEIREDTSPQLTTFFMIRMELEILDLIPVMAKHLSGMPGNQAVAMAERAWFLMFWRGIATRPDEPLPFLPESGRLAHE